jgi:hypothetical protein
MQEQEAGENDLPGSCFSAHAPAASQLSGEMLNSRPGEIKKGALELNSSAPFG